MMDLVEIDVVSTETAERGVDGVEDMFARRPVIPGSPARGARALRGHDEVATPSLEPAPEDRLGAPHGLERPAQRIDVGGVEERDATGSRAVEDGERRGLIALKPEGHGAETEAGDVKAGTAEPNVTHESRE